MGYGSPSIYSGGWRVASGECQLTSGGCWGNIGFNRHSSERRYILILLKEVYIMTTVKPARSRTIWIWLLIIASVLIAISDLVDAARFMGWLDTAMFDELEFVSPGVFWLGAFMSLLLAAIWFYNAVRLYNLDPRGWLFVVAIATINLIFLGMALFSGNTFSDIMWGVILNVAALVLGLLPSTKAAFGQA